ncbi:MAG: hypothetical protein HY318_06765 [Armatimonadetes bacterium]|nr:hypothetical protein [Armatimonadota bacterium]
MNSELPKQEMTQHERDQLRRDVIEGCRDMADVSLEVEREFHALDEEAWRTLDEEDGMEPQEAPSVAGKNRGIIFNGGGELVS